MRIRTFNLTEMKILSFPIFLLIFEGAGTWPSMVNGLSTENLTTLKPTAARNKKHCNNPINRNLTKTLLNTVTAIRQQQQQQRTELSLIRQLVELQVSEISLLRQEQLLQRQMTSQLTDELRHVKDELETTNMRLIDQFRTFEKLGDHRCREEMKQSEKEMTKCQILSACEETADSTEANNATEAFLHNVEGGINRTGSMKQSFNQQTSGTDDIRLKMKLNIDLITDSIKQLNVTLQHELSQWQQQQMRCNTKQQSFSNKTEYNNFSDAADVHATEPTRWEHDNLIRTTQDAPTVNHQTTHKRSMNTGARRLLSSK